MLKVGPHGLLRFFEEVGDACEDWHNRHFVGLSVGQIQLDEQWSYIGKHKERMTKAEKRDHPEWGDSWLWAAIDRSSKVILSWHTGKRRVPDARAFVSDLAKRVEGNVEICTDQLIYYEFAIRGAFGDRADHAMVEKQFWL